jgi:hypothetical protein
LKTVEKTGQPEEGFFRVKDDLKNVEKKIEMRRNMERRFLSRKEN